MLYNSHALSAPPPFTDIYGCASMGFPYSHTASIWRNASLSIYAFKEIRMLYVGFFSLKTLENKNL